MFKKLVKALRDEANKRGSIRVDTSLMLCLQIIYNHGSPNLPIRYGRCFCSSTVDVSAGGLAVKHMNILIKGDTVLVRAKRNLKEAKCMTCPKFHEVAELDVQKDVVGIVRWRSAKACGIQFIEVSDHDRQVFHQVAWEQHMDDVRRKKLMESGVMKRIQERNAAAAAAEEQTEEKE